MEKYVLGFAFNQRKDYVVLIMKNKPAWQKGNFNGVGGKIEESETPMMAMVREFKEETGLYTDSNDWKTIGKMGNKDWECHIFSAYGDDLMGASTNEVEEISVLPVVEVIKGDYPTISNVPFLIELCRDENGPQNVYIQYAQ